MSDVTSEAQPPAPLLRFVLRNFVIYNPLFVFSALLALAGALLINPPGDNGGRDLLRTAQLFGVIQLYECALLGAAWLLGRRFREVRDPFAAETRDVRFLLLVFAPFLLDVTFTTSSLGMAVLNGFGASRGVLLAAAVVVCALLKVHVALRLVKIRFRQHERIALVLGPVVVLVAPTVGGVLALEGHVLWVGPVLGLLVGGLIAAYGALAGDEGSAWVMKRVAPLALVAAAVHATSTAYTFDGELLQTLGLAVIALGFALPRLAPLGEAETPVRVALPWVGAIACGIPAGSDDSALAWGVALAALLVVQGGAFLRTRQLPFLAGTVFAAYLACHGNTLPEALSGLGTRASEPLILSGLILIAGLRGVPAERLAWPLIAVAVLAARLALFEGTLDYVVGWNVLGVGVLAAALRDHGRSLDGATARGVGILLLVLPAGYAVLYDAPHALAWAGSVVGGLALLGALTRLPAFAFPLLLLPVEALSGNAPSTALAWGVMGLATAFCGLGAGVWISLHRERLLAWLDATAEAAP